MPIRTDIIGFTQQITQEITPRWVLAYAASLGFDGPFLDDAVPGGPLIPPTFCVCPEWALVGSEERVARLGITPDERRRNVHAVQDSTFHAPFRAGMRLTTTSTLAYARATSAGALIATKLESRDADTGAAIVTSWSTAIMRGVAFAGPMEMAPPAEVPAAPPSGATGQAALIPTARSLPHLYSEAARIWNPIHTERAVALAAGLEDIIIHGTITWALAGKALGDVMKLRRLSARFRAPVIPGESFTVQGAGPAFTALTQTGAVALADGWALFATPSSSS
jgi:acyl dehydratase